VARGFTQRHGVDYDEVFSPVTRLGSVRCIIGIAASGNLKLTQFDVYSAFLYGRLQATVYMQQPEGYQDGSGRVCKLKRSLYGLKQTSRVWNQTFSDFLVSIGFVVSKADRCIYVRLVEGRNLIVCLCR